MMSFLSETTAGQGTIQIDSKVNKETRKKQLKWYRNVNVGG